MRILLNGEPHDRDAPLAVQALLERLAIEDGAEVEIVAFVGGGSI
jgi:sulfur carrier protein ThiS